MTWHRLAAAAVLFAGSACAGLVSSAAAEDVVRTKSQWMDKAQGGEPYYVECKRGTYLSGFEGRAGAWIDHVRIVCARWDAQSGRLEPPMAEETQIGQSQGGEETHAVCPTGLAIGDRYDDVYARDEDTFVLHSLEFHCVNAADGMRPKWRKFGSTSPTEQDTLWWEAKWQTKGCPEGYLATGVYGRAGHFVDTLGFVCRPRPKRRAATGVNPRAKYENPAVEGAKPLDNVTDPAAAPAVQRRKIP